MKKGAYVTFTVLVEGEDDPSNNFYALVTKALKWAFEQITFFPEKIGLKVTIVEMYEDPRDLEN